MPEFKPTAAQQAAIESRGGSVLVSAGAGSGKTRVLTERLMGYLTDPEHPVDLDRFLIITFTRAAAAELKSRITQAITEALAADPGNKRLRRQNALCQRAQIGTIHRFCGELLRENAYALSLPPDFKILDEERGAAMKAAALERCLESCYADELRVPGFLLLADTVGAGRDDRRLAALVLELHGKMQSHARPEDWAAQQSALLAADYADAGGSPWGRELLQGAKAEADYWQAELARLLALAKEEEKLFAAYAPSLGDTSDALFAFSRALDEGWDAARACLPIPFPRLNVLRNPPDPALAETVKARRAACKAAMEKLAERFTSDSATLLAELKQTAPAMDALLKLTLLFDDFYAKEKRRAGAVDFADLEHMAARLLTHADGSPTQLALDTAARYTEIMVDEYQDVSQVQDTIFRAISQNGANRFLVGDAKQSIYRFRLADPSIFTDKYRRWPDAAAAIEGQSRRILLRENFRSRREVLSAANAVFLRCMSQELGEIDYDENAMLLPGASYPGEAPVPELLLLAAPDADESGEAPVLAELEARLVAGEINKLIASGATVWENGAARPLDYGDIAILLRSANSIGGTYRRVLIQCGVPVALGQGGGFYRAPEISTALSLLAVLDNPHQDIPLIAALRSPLFGFTADELSEIRAGSRDGNFYTALCAAAETLPRAAAFLSWLIALRALVAELPVEELVWRLLEELDMPAVYSAMADGAQRRARLLTLPSLAQRFESGGYRGLHRFVLWLRRQAEQGQEPSVGAANGSAVQILSVHKSKGLEFPVVFLCDTARRFNKRDSAATVLVHPLLGLGAKVTDLQRRVEYPTLARHAIARRLTRETLSEELRLLYVAMTRARERLFVTASMKEPLTRIEKQRAALSEPFEPELLAGASCPADWLICAALADGEAHLRLSVREAEDIPAAEAQALSRGEADGETLAELERRLSWRYPHAEAQALPSKLTATELKGRAEPDEDAQSLAPSLPGSFRLPDFTRKDRPLSGAQRGTATHLLLQYMDFAAASDLRDLERERERLRAAHILSDREAEAVDLRAVHRLFASPLGKRMLKAAWRQREFAFSLLCDAQELLGQAEGEQILLQGVVDCCIEEDGQLVIIDYKTDAVRGEALTQRAAHYAGQLKAYARALQRIFAKPVKECVLYFLAAGQEVRIDPDASLSF